MDLKEAEILGSGVENHWYYASKADALAATVGGLSPHCILDVGAGSGFFSKWLLARTGAQRALLVDTGYVEERDVRSDCGTLSFRRSVEASDADLVLLMDVLEHVDDDVALLEHYVACSSPGAHYVITVPAFQFLWSGHDVFLGHKRRYTLEMLERVVSRSGLSLVSSFYYFAGVFPLAAGVRLWQRYASHPGAPKSHLQRHSSVVNRALRAVSVQELRWLGRNKRFGLTAFALARKP